MKQEEVIELGRKSLELNESPLVALGAFMMVGALFSFALCLDDDFSWKYISRSTLGSLSIFVFIGGIVIGVMSEEYGTQKQVEQITYWKQNVAIPYIESLPIQRRSILSVKLGRPTAQEEKKDIRYTEKTSVGREAPLTIAFEKDGLTTLTGVYKTDMTLRDVDQPYVTYQYVSKKLGEDFGKGFYDVEVHLPKNYKFTDIK